MRSLSLCSMVVVLAYSTLVAEAQQVPTTLQDTLTAPQSNEPPMSMASLAAKLRRLEQRVIKLQDQLDEANVTIAEQDAELGALSLRVSNLARSFSDVTTEDPTSQQTISNVLGNMQKSEAFQGQMRDATQGRLLIRNYTGLPQLVYINGTPWQARRNDSYIWVPLGVVSIQESTNSQPKLVNNWKFKKNPDPATRPEVPNYSEATFDLRN